MCLFLAVFAGCRQPEVAQREAPRPRLVLLYATCSLNKSYLSAYDDSVPYTPAIGAFARSGKVFEGHRAQVGVSGPSFASIFSGADMAVNGAYFHPKLLPERVFTLAEAFAEEGWDTHSWLRHPQANDKLNYAQGVAPERRRKKLLMGRDPQFREVLDRLVEDPDRRALMIANFTVTHYPYNPGDRLVTSGHQEPVIGESAGVKEFCGRYPGECTELTEAGLARYREVFLGDRGLLNLQPDLPEVAKVAEIVYKANVNKLDRLFGNVIAEIERRGLLADSLIVFTADHGEFLYDESRTFNWSHGRLLTPMDLEPPLILVAPGVEPGRVDTLSRHIDLFPTVAALAGVPIAEERCGALLGTDLSAPIRGRQPWPELTAFSSTSLKPIWTEGDRKYRTLETISVALRSGDSVYKLMAGGGLDGAHVYDLNEDPMEKHDLFDAGNETHRRMMRRLVEYRRRLIEAYPQVAEDPLVDEKLSPEALRELDETLRALGYVG